MSQILIHPSITNKNYSGITQALLDSELYNNKITVANLHNECFDTIAKLKPSIVILPSHEYTQEIHAAIENYSNTTFLLLIDNITVNTSSQIKELMHLWTKQKNVKMISENNDLVKNLSILKYDYLYDDNVFKNLNFERNDKTCVILSSDNQINNKINKLIYPHNLNVLCFNNPSFDNPSNLGVLSYADLNIVFNTFSKTIDLTEQFAIESQICGCNRVDIDNITVMPKIETDKYDTFTGFIKSHNIVTYTLGS